MRCAPLPPPRLFTTARPTHRACSPTPTREMGFAVELASAFLESFTVTHPTHRACSPTTTPRLGHRTSFPNAGGHERLGALCFNKHAKVAKLGASLPVLSPATVNKRGSFPQFSHTPTYQHFPLGSLEHSFSIAEARHLLPPFTPQSRSPCTVSRRLASATSARP